MQFAAVRRKVPLAAKALHDPADQQYTLRKQKPANGEIVGWVAQDQGDVHAVGLALHPEQLCEHFGQCARDFALLAQYSISFCVAFSLYRNPVDPDSFDDQVHRDSRILAMAARVKMDTIAGQPNDDLTSIVTVALKDGRGLTRTAKEFPAPPARPLNEAGLREKFMLLTKRFPQPAMDKSSPGCKP